MEDDQQQLFEQQLENISLSDNTDEEEASVFSDSDELHPVSDCVRQWIQTCDNCDDESVSEDNFSSHEANSDPEEVIIRGVQNSKKFLEEIRAALNVKKRRNDLESCPNISKVVDLDGVEKFICTICERSFSHRSNIRYHIACGDSKECLMCKFCDKRFKSNSHLKYHIRTVHTKDLPYKCSQCDKAFAQIVKLKRHQQIHSGERPFQCDTCQKNFQTKYQLKEHKNIHSSANHYPCTKCDKKFADKNNLRRHFRVFHKIDPVKCTKCGQVCESRFEFDNHCLRNHQTFTNICSDCGKGFKSKQVLERHMLVHVKPKSFSCYDCDKAFSRKDHLKRHMIKIHKQREARIIRTFEDEEDIDGDLHELVVDEEMEDVSDKEPEYEPPRVNNNPHILGSINQLPAAIYNDENFPSMLKDFTSSQINQVIENMEPRQIQALKSIINFDVCEPLSPLQPTVNVKKKLLKRYRNQSGLDDGGQFSQMNLSSSQREAATKALALWVEENRDTEHAQIRDTCTAQETHVAANTCSQVTERTVIKMTPQGPRKITIYDGDMQDE